MKQGIPRPEKDRIAFAASLESIGKAESALKKLGLKSKRDLANATYLPQRTIEFFFMCRGLRFERFQQICEALGLGWQDIAETAAETEDIDTRVNPSPVIEKELDTGGIIIRTVTLIDKENEEELKT